MTPKAPSTVSDSAEPPGASIFQSILAAFGSFSRRFSRGAITDRDELIERLHDAEAADIIDPDTLAMMEGAVLVSENKVRDVMIPRSQMTFVDEDQERAELLKVVTESGYSRFPLFDDKRERVLGIVLAKDLLSIFSSSTDEVPDLRDISRPAQFVPESKRLNILLREFKTSRNHLAIVVDEYGGISGMVTIEDVLEQIVGEIDDEHDFDDEEMIKAHRRGRWTVKAHTPLSEFNETFGSSLRSGDYDTIGGFLMGELGRLPKRGETFPIPGYDITVLRADRRRARLLKVVKLRD